MGVENLQLGNAWLKQDFEHRACQSFKPDTDFTLEWLDIYCRYVDYGCPPRARLFFADIDGHPLPDELSHDIIPIDPPKQWFLAARWRLKMSAVTLYAGNPYALVTYGTSRLPEVAHDIQYQSGIGTYPLGFMSRSADGGATWTSYPADDLVFTLFGTPPAPPPPPEPPITHFAILDVIQELTLTGFQFLVTTSVPSHLYMAWTDREPDKHRTAILRRGELWKDAIRFCFVGWRLNEQEEPGDTLYHTFIKEPWPSCETRWFVFRAKINEEWSPSISPIFTKHRPTEGYILILLEPWTVTYEPPDFDLMLSEPWTLNTSPPKFEEVIIEPWTS